MATRKQKAKVGFFLLVCGVIIAVGLLLISGYKQEPKVKYWIEFRESVLGLGNGSIVVYQGVNVGNVENIYVTDKNTAHVDFFVFRDKVTLKEGVHGQLVLYSLATGVMSISLTGGDETPLPPGSEIKSTPSLIQSVSSQIEETMAQVQDVTKKLNSALKNIDEGGISAVIKDTDGLLKSGQEFMDTVNEKVDGLGQGVQDSLDQVRDMAKKAQQLIKDVNATVLSVQKKVDALEVGQIQANANKVMENVADLSKRLQQTAESIDKLSKTATVQTGNVEYSLRETLRTLNDSLNAVRDFMNYLKQDPSALIRGRTRPAGE